MSAERGSANGSAGAAERRGAAARDLVAARERLDAARQGFAQAAEDAYAELGRLDLGSISKDA